MFHRINFHGFHRFEPLLHNLYLYPYMYPRKIIQWNLANIHDSHKSAKFIPMNFSMVMVVGKGIGLTIKLSGVSAACKTDVCISMCMCVCVCTRMCACVWMCYYVPSSIVSQPGV